MAIKKVDTKKLKQEDIDELHDFYTVTSSGGTVNIKFDRLMVCDRLRKLGFYRYDIAPGEYEIVRIVNGKMTVASELMVKDVFQDFILSLPNRQVKYITKDPETKEEVVNTTEITSHKLHRVFINCQDKYFKPLLDRLRPQQEIELFQDSPTEKYIYYNNCVIKITRDGYEKMEYTDKPSGIIWDNNILNRDFVEDNGTGEFETFVNNICERKKDRVDSLRTMMGYLMHDNYECNLFAILLTDVNQDDESGTKAAGGTGKGILGKALAQMMNRTETDNRYRVVPGKGFDATKETRYQLADISTQLIHIEDLDQRFDIRDLYNDITDGATFRKLFQGATIHKTKFMLSVNHTIRIDSSSDKRRLRIFELYNHYDERFTPVDEFGHLFFGRDWTERDWHQFDTFMINSIIRYLRYGVKAAEVINYGNRRINELFYNQEDFKYFIQDEVEKALKSQDHKLWKNTSYTEFIAKFPIHNNRKDLYKFTTLLKSYLDLRDIPWKICRTHAEEYYQLQPIPDGVQSKLELPEPEP